MARLTDLDRIVTPTLLRRFELEAEADQGDTYAYYGAILRADRVLLVYHPFSLPVAPEQLVWAADTLRFLNHELHFDGAWVVVFTHPQPVAMFDVDAPKHTTYDRYVLLWMDNDGDVQVPVEWTAGTDELREFADVLLAGLTFQGNSAANAHAMWVEAMKALGARAEEKYRRAAGERPPSATH